MKIELLETVKHERDTFEKGDIRTVSDGVGNYFCSCGWAKDIDGNVTTGERNTSEVRLTPNDAFHNNSTGEV